MRSLLSATALSAMLALAGPALAQGAAGAPGGPGTGTGSTGPVTPQMQGQQMQGQSPGSPLPMTQPGPGTMSTSQRPATAAGAMGATGSQPSPGMGASNMPGGAMSGDAPGVSGQSGSQSMTMDDSQVRDLLRSQGYSDVQSVMRDGNSYRARATQNGRTVDLSIDAYTGTIRNQAARR